MYTVSFKIPGQRNDVKVPAAPGDNILDLARNNGVDIDAPCSGSGTCGKCVVRLISGSCEAIKNQHLSEADFEDGWRLACQCTVNGDAVFLLPAMAGTYKTGIDTADLSSPEELELYNNSIDAIFSTGLARGVQEQGYGIAIDIGTTTVTGALLDLSTGKVIAKASRGNGQIRYGADVINRIIQQGKPGGVEKLRSAVREETVVPIITTMMNKAGLTEDQVTRLVFAGNTTMEHLFAGVDAESIRSSERTGPASVWSLTSPNFWSCTGRLPRSSNFPSLRTRPSSLRRTWEATLEAISPRACWTRCSGPETTCLCSSTSEPTANWYSATPITC